MDASIRKRVLRLIPYGLYAVTCAHEGEVNGFTASWLTQVSFEPHLLAIAVRAESRSREMIAGGGGFVVNFVGQDRQELIKTFFQPIARVGDRLAGEELVDTSVGVPRLGSALAWAGCRVVDQAQPGDHVVFFAEVVDVGCMSEQPPLALADTPWSYGG